MFVDIAIEPWVWPTMFHLQLSNKGCSTPLGLLTLSLAPIRRSGCEIHADIFFNLKISQKSGNFATSVSPVALICIFEISPFAYSNQTAVQPQVGEREWEDEEKIKIIKFLFLLLSAQLISKFNYIFIKGAAAEPLWIQN